MKRFIYLIASLLLSSGMAMAQYDDDIYYNPNKSSSKEKKTSIRAGKTKGGNYNPNLGEKAVISDSDLDAYNRFGASYYDTSVDTIGAAVANSEDFVYTQQIQKYYNPTIVTDNSDVLADVLNNSYGNVQIVYQGGFPCFSSWSYLNPWYTPYWSYSPAYSWYWGPSWSYWSPWYWGPSWSYYSPWYWDSPWYGPGWGWGPGWGSGWAWSGPSYHHWNNAHRNPGAGRPGPGHRYNTGLGRNPGGNRFTAGGTGIRPGSTHRRPSQATLSGTTRPGSYHRGDNVRQQRPGTAAAVNPDRYGNISSGVSNDHRVTPSTSGNSHRDATTIRNTGTSSRYNDNRNISTNRNNNATVRNNSGSQRNTNSGSYRNSSSGSRAGSFGGSRGGGSRGGGSRGGGGHRR